MAKGYLAFILHAHLPYVYHPEYDSFLEERWFFEAVTETYIPLIKFCDKLLEDKVDFKITISISPPLLAMMENLILQERYLIHINKLIDLSEKEMERNKNNGHFNWLAQVYKTIFIEAKDIFLNQYGRRLSTAFKKFHEAGIIELITSTATHGLLPLLASRPKAVNTQIVTGLNYFEKTLGFKAKGIWLPECGYYPGVEEMLQKQGIKYFLVESHGIEHASTNPFHNVYKPIYTNSGVAAFGRDKHVTKQVWSAREGFPGHPDYREFYRDIGYDLDINYIRPYIEGDIRIDTGIKYYRITGPTPKKDAYNFERAKERAAVHAGEFLRNRISHIEHLNSKMNSMPIVIAPFDAEYQLKPSINQSSG